MPEVNPEQTQTPPVAEEKKVDESLSRTEKFLEYFGRWDDKHHYATTLGLIFTSGGVATGIGTGDLLRIPMAAGFGLAVGMWLDRQENKTKAKRLNRDNSDE